jgi:hypothetical protein
MLRWALLTALALGPLRAQPLEGFHIAEAVVPASHGWQFNPQVRFRMANQFHTLSQLRSGLIVTKSLLPHLELWSAAYWEPTLRQPRHRASTRLQLGIQSRYNARPALAVQTRLMVERLYRTNGLLYSRLRLGNRVTFGQGKYRPYLTNDTLAVRQGFHSSRSGAGLAWDPSPGVHLEFEYVYDRRRAYWGGDRQILTTRIQFRPKVPRP